MATKVDVELPLNLDKNSSLYFSPYASYEVSSLKVRNLRNVLITSSGLVINKHGLVKECHHADPDHHHEILNEASCYYYDAQDHPENLILLDEDRKYLVVHHPWYNYYHWLCESIPRIWMVKEHLHHLTLLLPDFYQYSDFIMGSLAPFNLGSIRYLPDRKCAWARQLCLPQIKPVCDSYDVGQLKEIRQFYLRYLQTKDLQKINLGDKIYLSRKKATRKKVDNEDLVEALVKSYGFSIVCNEDYSFLEQIGIYSNASILVSIHGSGLTNMLFMKEHSRVLEVLKTKTNVLSRPSFVFWYEAAALGFKYYQQLVEFDVNDDYFHGNFKIDIPLLERNIRLLLSR